MNIVFNNVDRFNKPIANPDAAFVADENTAKTILESTFFNNITLTFNVCLGFFPGPGDSFGSPETGSGSASPNLATLVEVTYGDLRTALLNSGQPTFFTAANLPAGNGLPINLVPPPQQP